MPSRHPDRVRTQLVSLLVLVASGIGCATPEPVMPPPREQALALAREEKAAWASLDAERALDYPTLGYHIQVGDRLSIKFYYQPDLNEDVIVRPDGRISFQLVGEVQAAGLTPPQLEERLAEHLQGVLRRPEPTVIVREFRPANVFIGGEVKSPGAVGLRGAMTALRAITAAGGPLPTGAMDSVLVVRQRINRGPAYLHLDLEAALDEEADQDLALHPNDIVFVPQTKIAEINEAVDQYFEELFEINRTVGVFYDLSDGNR